MARIELAPGIQEDFDRTIEHLQDHDAPGAEQLVDDIVAAIDLLETSPLVGRPCDGELRELVIGRASSGYVALYQYFESIDVVFVLAIRSQREAGYVLDQDEPDPE